MNEKAASKTEIRHLVREELVTALADRPTRDEVRVIVREETAHFATKDDSTRLELMFENLQTDFTKMMGMLSDALRFQKSSSDYNSRLGKIEADNELLKSTVTLHSRQLGKA